MANNRIEDISKYARLMRGLPINHEKDTELEEAFEFVDRIESMLEKQGPNKER